MTDPTQREGDDVASQEYKRRKITMPLEGPALAINGTMAKVRLISLVLKEVSNAGLAMTLVVVVVAFVLAWFSGWIPFPLAGYFREYQATHAEFSQHLGDIDKRLTQRQTDWERERRAFTSILIRICVNTTPTLQEKAKCYPTPE